MDAPIYNPQHHGVPRITLRARDAAKSLGISERTLQTLTAAKNIPHFRVGRAVLYSPSSLESWAREASANMTAFDIGAELGEARTPNVS